MLRVKLSDIDEINNNTNHLKAWRHIDAINTSFGIILFYFVLFQMEKNLVLLSWKKKLLKK